MKRFKLMKGMLACLLSLALVFSVVGPVGAWAAPVAEKVTLDNQAADLVEVTLAKSTSGESAESAQTISGSGDITDGDTVYVTVEAKSGKDLSEVKIGGEAVTATSGKYTKTYKIGEGGTSAASGLEVVVTAVEEQKDTVTAVYNPETDQIDFTSTKQTGKVFFANVKKATGNKIGKGYSSVDLKDGKASLVLNNKDLGLNVASNKDLFLWYGLTEPDEKSKAVVKPLLTVYGSKEKPVITLNYASEGDGDRSGIASIQKKSGKSMVNVDFADVSYCYAADGTTYGEWKPAENLNGDEITAAIKAVADGNKAAFKFKINAKAADEEVEETVENETTAQSGGENGTNGGSGSGTNAGSGSGTNAGSGSSVSGESGSGTSGEETTVAPAKNDKNVRASKEIVVKVKKQANAPKVKVDYAKETIAIKNGFDYAVKSTSGEVAVDEWTTILQNKKGAKAEEDTIKTVDYVPAKDPKANAEMFTKATKRKSTSIAELFKAAGNPDTIYIYVRKSATTKAPASAVTTIVVSKPAAATAFGNAIEVEGEKGKKGYTYTLSFPDAFAEGYEYVIIKEGEDYTKVKKWTKIKAGKGITVGKDKSSVNKKAILAADGKFYVLIRKSMVKSGDNAGFASEITWTKVGEAVTSGSGDTATSKVTWEACDAPAAPVAKYTVTYKANGGSGEDIEVKDQAAEYTLAENTFTAPGEDKVFKGWATSASGDATAAGTKVTLTADTTYFAIWGDPEAAGFTITLEADEGVTLMNKTGDAALTLTNVSGEVMFKVSVVSGTVAAVEAGGNTLTADNDNVYTVTITADTTITVRLEE